MNNRRSHSVYKTALLVFSLALLALVVAVTSRVELVATSAHADELPTSLVEVVDDSPATATALPDSDPAFDPFPVTGAMTDTVQSVLDEYTAAQGEGAQSAADSEPVGPVEVANHIRELYLPNVAASRLATAVPPTQTRTPVPPTRTPTPRPDPVEWPDPSVTIWPSPSIRVIRGGTLAYEIRVTNYGDSTTRDLRVSLPFSKAQMDVTSSSLGSGDWVSERTNDRVTVTFSSVRPDEKRTGTLYFRVNDWLADNTVINMRASYRWGADESGTTNWAPVLVGAGSASASWLWMSVDPTAGWPGTTHHFFSDRFVPGEGVVTWLNTPSGVKPLDLRTTADSFGRARIDFKSTGLRPGTYSFVLYGARSNLTALATFYVW